MKQSVYSKLLSARIKLQSVKINKSGMNKFVGYSYFELGDFLPTIQNIFQEVGLCGVISCNSELASIDIIDTETGDKLTITTPMGSAALKGCHEVQNIGAVITYQRRYLWMLALEIVEHDILDAQTTNETPVKFQKKATNGSADNSLPLLHASGEIKEAKTETQLHKIYGDYQLMFQEKGINKQFLDTIKGLCVARQKEFSE